MAAWKIICSIGLMLLPAITFYTILVREAVNLPFLDDYYSVLDLVNAVSRMQSLPPRAVFLLTSQQKEYKPIFENVVFAVQYYAAGHIDFLALMYLGNLFVAFICLLLFRMYYRKQQDLGLQCIAFVPAAYLIFQLQYASTLDWAMGTLQNLTVPFFALLSIRLLSKETRLDFFLATVSLALAIASSGNGFFVIPIGVLMLWQTRRLVRLIPWTLVSIGMLGIYRWRYVPYTQVGYAHRSPLQIVTQFNPLYSLSFLGSSIAGFYSYIPSILLGTALCVLFGFLVQQKYYRRNAALFYSMVFIFITAIGVAFLRGNMGLAQSLASRYRIYSNLLLTLVYLVAAQSIFQTSMPKSRKYGFLAASLLLAVGFNIGSDIAGYHFLHARKNELVRAMAEWERPGALAVGSPVTSDESAIIVRQRAHNEYQPVDGILKESIHLRTYTPPMY